MKPKIAVKKSADLLQAERDAASVFDAWCRSHTGRAAELSRKTGINDATICRMRACKQPIDLTAAILFEIATNRVMVAENLCPSMRGILRLYKDAGRDTPKGELPFVK